MLESAVTTAMPIAMPPADDGAAAPSESREKSRILVPPRSAVPVPGAERAFGRGFWNGLRQEPGAWFLVFFCLFGLAFFTFGLAGTVGPYKEPLRETGDPRFFLAAMAMGAVFFLVPLRMLQLVLTGAGNAARLRRERGAKERPWEWDYPWRPQGMRPDYTADTGGMVLGRVAFLAMLGVFNVAWASPSWLLKGIVLLIDLFGLLIVYDSLAKLLQWMRFRQPSVVWTTFPARLGGELAATVRFPRALRPAGPVQATLRCVRDEWTERATREGTRRELEPHACWTGGLEVPLPGAPGARLRSLDVRFDVPADLPGTDFQQDEATYWQLLLQVPLTGPDFETVFLAPVYRKR